MSTTRYPVINLDECLADQACVAVCEKSVFDVDDDSGKPFAARPDDCDACESCVTACPVECIEIVGAA